MGAGQIGGIATLLDLDFNNAAGFVGTTATKLDGQFVVYYFSHAMLFCAGALIEPHMVLTPAVCVYAEDHKFDVYGGSHKFREGFGTSREVDSVCIHRAYNHTQRWDHCATDNIALLVLNRQFVMRFHEPKTEYIMNRVRYGIGLDVLTQKTPDVKCRYFGWGSRRNGFLLPLLLQLRKVDVKIYMDGRKCEDIWNTNDKYLCLSRPECIDDLGSVLVCGGYVQGMMTSELIDRPCGAGFLNIALYTKFLECAIDDSRDDMEEVPPQPPQPPTAETVVVEETTLCEDCGPKVTLSKPTKMDKEAHAESLLTGSHVIAMTDAPDNTLKPGRVGRYLKNIYKHGKKSVRGVYILAVTTCHTIERRLRKLLFALQFGRSLGKRIQPTRRNILIWNLLAKTKYNLDFNDDGCLMDWILFSKLRPFNGVHKVRELLEVD